MEEFQLPHHHGEHSHTEYLHGLLLKQQQFDTVAEYFKQLSDPTRVRIFWLLSHREECVVNIAALLQMSSPAVSHHLRTLTEYHLLESRRDGKEVYYTAIDTPQNHLLHEIVEQMMAVACPEKLLDTRTTPEETVRNVHRYLTEHYAEHITIEELSRKFLINSTTLKTVFKQVYGTTIADHRNTHRMQQAAALLTGSVEEIARIAGAVGFDSPARFTTAFRQAYGMTPSEYRKSHSTQNR